MGEASKESLSLKLLLNFLVLALLWTPLRADVFSLEYPNDPEKIRGVWSAPLLSFFLPGADQWSEGQYQQGAFYSGIAATGLTAGLLAYKQIDTDCSDCPENEPARFLDLGYQLYLGAGSLSAYASFRSAAKVRKKKRNEFAFLETDEPVNEVLLSPFHFSYFKRWTTYVPLAFASLAFMGRGRYHFGDAAFAGAVSYNAGTGEEAFFRGWLMPATREATGSDFLSNFLTAALFSAAHGTSQIMWPQFFGGFYFGWLTQRNNWSIGESVFVHFWWDVIVIGTEIARTRRDYEAAFFLPLLNFTY
ncbi:MAG TPA: CPBP family intramembrane glutamic endopeptidase [Bacteriovoracaceae bacterium]|nr:CPBP family intramembrane glutamic endopeptidase [Bacteriovoracaceae bacterium]